MATKFVVILKWIAYCLVLMPRTRAANVQFSGGFNIQLNHLTIDNSTGSLFVGAVNHLYQLDEDLYLQNHAVTGPIFDNVLCQAPGVSSTACERNKQTDNHNKLLIVDYDGQQLITCGSIYQGTCEIRDARNVSVVKRVYRSNTEKYVAANDPTSSTVGFIAPGSMNSNVLYVATTYTGKGENGLHREDVPAISSRNVDFSYAFRTGQTQTGTFISFSGNLKYQFPVEYIAGFSYGRYSYFLVNQKKTVTGSAVDIVSKIVRICQKDKYYYSYVEIPIKCQTDHLVGSSSSFEVIQAAYLGTAGSILATEMGISRNENVLYAIFRKGNTQVSAQFALCVIPMNSVDRAIYANYRTCYNNGRPRGAPQFQGGLNCKTTLPFPSQGFDVECGSEFLGNFNTPLGGDVAANMTASVMLQDDVTGIVTSTEENHTIGFLGTRNGIIKKVELQSHISARIYENISIANEAVLGDMTLDKFHKQLYVLTTYKVIRLKVENCSSFEGCSACISAKDPYCGWCSLENRCSRRSECSLSHLPRRWLSYQDNVCVAITSVTPNKLPVSHGTQEAQRPPRPFSGRCNADSDCGDGRCCKGARCRGWVQVALIGDCEMGRHWFGRRNHCGCKAGLTCVRKLAYGSDLDGYIYRCVEVKTPMPASNTTQAKVVTTMNIKTTMNIETTTKMTPSVVTTMDMKTDEGPGDSGPVTPGN